MCLLEIIPGSRYKQNRRERKATPLIRHAQPLRSFIPGQRSTRPILRPELFDKLVLRMRTLLEVTMEWPKGKER